MKKKLLLITMTLISSLFSLNISAQLTGFYQEDFEGTFPPPGWQTVNVLDPLNIWEQSSVDVYSGSYSAHINWSDYEPNEDWLILPQFSATSADSISFWLATDYVGFPPDSIIVMVSTTDANLANFTNVLATLYEDTVNQAGGYPAIPDVFYYYSYSLNAFAGQDIYVAFKHFDNYGDGVFIDQVSIGNQLQTVDAVALSIDVPDFISSNTFSPMGTVKNNSVDVESFIATLTAPGYSSTKDVTNLASGAIQQLTFDPWTPSLGPNTLTLTVTLTADVDVSNDVINKTVNAYESFVNYGWTAKTSAPVAAFNPASAAINYSNGTSTVFMLGGQAGYYFLNNNNGFDPVTNSWSGLTSLPSANSAANAAVINGKVYLAGGYTYYYGDNQIYDIATNSWSFGTPMPAPVGDYAFGVYHDSLLYYIGGFDQYSYYGSDLVQIYDPGTDTWVNGTNTPVPGLGWQAAIVGNKIVLMGGEDNSYYLTAATYVGTIDPSNPATISWAQVDDYPVGTLFRGGSGSTIDPTSSLAVFTGGSPSGSGTDKTGFTFAYDVNSESWKIGPIKPTAANNLRNMSCAVYNDSLYLVSLGGYSGTGALNVNEWLNMGPAPLGTAVSGNFTEQPDIVSFPNPFSRFTILTFKLKQAASVRISIADVTGKEVAVLCDKQLTAGDQQITWDAKEYSAGVYFCNVDVDGQVTTQKLVKLR